MTSQIRLSPIGGPCGNWYYAIEVEGRVDGKESMKQIESKDVNVRLVSSHGKAVNASEGNITLFYKPVFNKMLDLERNCFLHLVEEEDNLFKMHDWEKGKDPVS